MRSSEPCSIHLLKVNLTMVLLSCSFDRNVSGGKLRCNRHLSSPFEHCGGPFNTAHMNGGDGGGMTLGKALSKHYTTNTTWFGCGSAASRALKFIMSTQLAFRRCRLPTELDGKVLHANFTYIFFFTHTGSALNFIHG